MTAELPSWRNKQSEALLHSILSFFNLTHNSQVGLRFFIFTFLLLFTAFSPSLWANNLSISNAVIINEDSQDVQNGTLPNNDTQTAVFQFNLYWDNAWKDSINNDAVWLFFKYSVDGGTTWNHATMKTAGTNPTGFSDGTMGNYISSLDMIVPPDKKGVFIQPAHLASGTVSSTSVQVVWDWKVDLGETLPWLQDSYAAANIDVRVFGVEMVYVPQEGFYLGDSNSSGSQFVEYGGVTFIPAAISSEQQLNFQASSGSTNKLYYIKGGFASGDDNNTGTAFGVSEAFPKGFHDFYLMKYEISEEQYVGFLNSISRLQQNKRVITDVSGDIPASNKTFVMSNTNIATNRSTIQCPASGNGTSPTKIAFTSTYPDRAANYLRWMDLAAYADWAGLRPMTELEYEKAARGPIYPVASEYIYGTATSPTVCADISSGTETSATTCTTSTANAVYTNVNFSGGSTGMGPARVGMLAKSDTVTRLTSGAGYYGNMDLSGNVWEWTVTLGNAAGRGFAGTHGDGTLTTLSSYEGNATNLDWPGIDATTSRGVTGGSGTGRRGGSWATNVAAYLQISHRYYAGDTDTTATNDFGGRCARTAPD